MKMKCNLVVQEFAYAPGYFIGFCELHLSPEWGEYGFENYETWVGSVPAIESMFEEHEEEYN